MPMHTPGIHHVTAVAGDPQANIDFYTGTLGLRLVKVTVNQDDPGTYHFFYGDEKAQPGTDLTFFPWPGARPGTRGVGQVTTTAFAVAPEALDYWAKRLREHGVRMEPPTERFGERVLPFYDPDGLRLELVASADADPGRAWTGGPVPADYALRGFYGVTIEVAALEPTAAVLRGLLGFEPLAAEGGRFRFRARGAGPASIVDVVVPKLTVPGRISVGTVHHVAWRVADDETQRSVLQEIRQLGLPVSGVIDRYYFRSVYFREPGGVLFEIATDGPGFTIDQPPEELGTRLVLPPFLEPRRAEIEARLPAVRLPGPVTGRSPSARQPETGPSGKEPR